MLLVQRFHQPPSVVVVAPDLAVSIHWRKHCSACGYLVDSESQQMFYSKTLQIAVEILV